MKICPICQAPHFSRNSVFCKEHDEAQEAGFLALVEIDNFPKDSATLKPHEANVTGQIAFLNKHTYVTFFGTPEDYKKYLAKGLVYVGPDSYEYLKKIATAHEYYIDEYGDITSEKEAKVFRDIIMDPDFDIDSPESLKYVADKYKGSSGSIH